jgi:hypothetical protein
MAIQPPVMSAFTKEEDFSFVLAKYLEALGAESFQALEDRTVNTLLRAWKASANGTPRLPVRLSNVVEAFDILRRPRVIEGRQDGDIRFDEEYRRFQITLYSENPDLSLDELASRYPRTRFTYAHEVAHRFCYVEDGGQWLRALDIATAHLDHAVRLQHRITLGRREEGFCNSVARRVLIPDEYMRGMCKVDEWLGSGPDFSRRLSETAHKFGVSWQCLFVSLKRCLPSGLPDPYCVMTAGRSAGPVTQRGRVALRLLTGILPTSARDRDVGWHTGLDLSTLGTSTGSVIEDLLGGQRARGDVELLMCFPKQQRLRLRGWFRILGAGKDVTTRAVVWGETRWE